MNELFRTSLLLAITVYPTQESTVYIGGDIVYFGCEDRIYILHPCGRETIWDIVSISRTLGCACLKLVSLDYDSKIPIPIGSRIFRHPCSIRRF